MKIVKDIDKLSKVCKPVPKDKFGYVRGILLREMLTRKNKAVGLAANQIGLNYRAFAMKLNNKIAIFINPEITDKWGDDLFLPERCLSLKKGYTVKRCMYIRVKDDFYTNGQTMALDNYAAQVFQHEIDHINGITIQTRSKDVKD